MNRFFLLLVATSLFCGFGCHAPKPGPAAPKSAASGDYRITPGDVLQFSFAGGPNLDRTQRVRADGKVALPTVGNVQVSGKTLSAVRTQLTEAYRPTLQNSEVTVSLESSTAVIYVSGAVNKPGKIPFDRPLSLLEAIMESGGVASGLANPKRVQIIRKIKGKNQAFTVDLRPALRGQAAEDIPLQRGDMIVVPEKWL